MKYGRLKILEETKIKYQKYYICECDCGKIKTVRETHLKSGKIKSCGCLKKEVHTKHGLSNTRLHKIWRGIKNRCLNENNPEYKYYGERGIAICNEWKNDFLTFYNWAISNGYDENLTLDRIDVNGNYEPNNCRWATRKEQANNTRKNKFIFYNNEKYTLSEFAEKFNINKKTLEYRVKNNKNLFGGKSE